MNRWNNWNKYKNGFVSEEREMVGLLAWWINNGIWVASLIYIFSNKIFEYDFTLFSNIIPMFFSWLSEHDPIGRLLAAPLAFISLAGNLLTVFILIIEPRKVREWKNVVLAIGVIYLVFEIPALIIARCLNSHLLNHSFFWMQIFFDLLMLFLIILKLQILNNERRKT